MVEAPLAEMVLEDAVGQGQTVLLTADVRGKPVLEVLRPQRDIARAPAVAVS
jgi:hypothetical protein